MGKTKVRISAELLGSFLQFPKGWQVSDVVFGSAHEFQPDIKELVLTVESEHIEDGVEYQGVFKSHTIDGEDGRWVQGKWEIAPIFYQTHDDIRRTLNHSETHSESTN